MHFEEGHMYHIYNQGNNRQRIFFDNRNYLYFMDKIRTYVLPYADLLAYCLMPNHFHVMTFVNRVEFSSGATQSRARTETGSTLRPIPYVSPRMTSFNRSIGIMLASYTRAINKQFGYTGSLFRKETKAICLTDNTRITPSWYNLKGSTVINTVEHKDQYPVICFNYIHNNPVEAGLVKTPGDWEFSSFNGIYGNKKDTLINIERIKELGLI